MIPIVVIPIKFQVCRSILHVLECCRTAAGLLQIWCRTDAYLLQIMKEHNLKMLHAKFEVSRSNSKRMKKEEKEKEETEEEKGEPTSNHYHTAMLLNLV